MASNTKSQQVRVRMQDDDIALFDALAGRALSRTDVATALLAAAAEAVRNNEGRVHFPPKFIVVNESGSDYRFNEPQPKKQHR